MHGYNEPVYLISIVAKVLNIHPQTLRQYEREGLVTPSRTDGKVRLYSQKDIDRIKMIIRLTRDLGVNLAGVYVILQLKEKIDEHEDTIEELKNKINKLTKQNTMTTKNALVERKHTYDIIIFGE